MTATIMRLRPALLGHVAERWERPPGESRHLLLEQRWFLSMPAAVRWALPRGPIVVEHGSDRAGSLMPGSPAPARGFDDLEREALAVAVRVALDEASIHEVRLYRLVWTELLDELA